MAVWFVSGIVMMYVGFPRLTEAERVRALAPIPWQGCCQFGEGLLSDDQPIVRAQLESHLGEPALRVRRVARATDWSISPAAHLWPSTLMRPAVLP